MERFNNSFLQERTITRGAYIFGIAVIFLSAYSQYFISGFGPVTGLFVVYGIPIAVISMIAGRSILSRFFRGNWTALKYGLGFFGFFSLLGGIAAAAIYGILAGLDPSALNLMHRANPVLHVRPDMAWLMVAASFLLIGPAEEYIFRGFVFGGLLKLYQNRHWILLASISSVLFAAAHLYYLLIYGAASLVPFAEIVTIGMAMAATFYFSGGNLLIPAMLHGAFDAAGFIATDISPETGIVMRQLMIIAGLITAAALYRSRRRRHGPFNPT